MSSITLSLSLFHFPSHLADHQPPVVGLCGIDDPQAILVHGQVNVGLAAPAVRRGVVVVCPRHDGLAALDARAQVELDDVARALLVEKECAVVHDEARAVHAVRQLVRRGGPPGDEVLLGRVLGESVGAVRRPRHVVDLVGGLQRVLTPRPGLMVRLEEVLTLVDAPQQSRTQENYKSQNGGEGYTGENMTTVPFP